MADVFDIPLHLAVHVGGLAAALGLVAFAFVRRDSLTRMWLAIVVGGLLIAASEVLGGALIAENTALPLYLRTAGYAGVALGAVGRVVGPAAAATAVPLASHVVAAVTGGLAALAAAGGALGRGRAVAGLSAGIGLWALGDLVTGTRPTVGAILSLAGSVAVLVWLDVRSRRSLASRFVAAFVAVLLAVVIVLASGAAYVFDRDLRDDRLDALDQRLQAGAAALTQDASAGLTEGLAVLSQGTDFGRRLATGDFDDDIAAEIAGIVRDADLIVLVDAQGRPTGSFDRATGEPVGTAATTLVGAPPVQTAREERAATDGVVRLEIESGATDAAELLAMAVQPLVQRLDGQLRPDLPQGVVVAAQRLTRRDRLEAISAQTGAEVAVLSAGSLAGATTGADERLDDDLQDLAGSSGTDVVDLAGRRTFVAATGVADVAGNRVGTLVLFEDATVVAGIEELTARVLFLAAAGGGLLGAVLAGVVTARTTRPVRRLTEAADRIAAGDRSVRVPLERRDEVGRLAVAFDHMADEVEAREDELVAAAERERQLRGRLESVTRSMTEGLLAVDAEGSITMSNPAAAELLDHEQDEMLGRPLDEVLTGTTADDRQLTEQLRRLPAGPRTVLRGRVARSDGRVIDVDATAAPLELDTGRGQVIVLRDVTGEAQLDRMKTEFLSNASHELNTPLTPIIGYVDTLDRHPDLDPATRAEFVGEIRDSALQLRRIVAMLVDFAELEAGRAHITPASADLSEIVDDALTRWRERHPERTYRRHLARDLPDVLADPRYTGRVLDELLDNATKFSDDTVVVTGDVDDDGRVRLEVRDRGVGIDPASLDEVRADFRQADGSATRHYGGLGLGLAIAERILAQQHGELEISSEVGRGTHVAVRFQPASSG